MTIGMKTWCVEVRVQLEKRERPETIIQTMAQRDEKMQ